jgi:hypothetical protein
MYSKEFRSHYARALLHHGMNWWLATKQGEGFITLHTNLNLFSPIKFTGYYEIYAGDMSPVLGEIIFDLSSRSYMITIKIGLMACTRILFIKNRRVFAKILVHE